MPPSTVSCLLSCWTRQLVWSEFPNSLGWLCLRNMMCARSPYIPYDLLFQNRCFILHYLDPVPKQRLTMQTVQKPGSSKWAALTLQMCDNALHVGGIGMRSKRILVRNTRVTKFLCPTVWTVYTCSVGAPWVACHICIRVLSTHL
jgi:hypothetical protein